jgi:DNA modification methylase
MSDDEYNEFTVNLFNEFDRILNLNGVVLYNISYGNNNRDGMFKAVNAIITNTPFTIADVIVWKKSSALPNNCSPNKLTRITEFVFVFCRLNEVNTYYCNKPVVSTRSTGQKSYGNIFNFIEAKNNDGSCPYNKATYSTELCEKLLSIYAPKNAYVYDPFMGSGTTAVACERMGFTCYGSEISTNQVKFSIDRIKKEFGESVDIQVVFNETTENLISEESDEIDDFLNG